MAKIRDKLLALLALGIGLGGCAPMQIQTDQDHYYRKIGGIHGEDIGADYLLSVEKDKGSEYLLEDRVGTLNALSKAQSRSLKSLCREADHEGDHVIDAEEFTALIKKMGKFEASLY